MDTKHIKSFIGLNPERFLRYCCVGLGAFAIDTFSAWSLLKLIPEVLAVASGYTLASVFHYTFSKGWTFSDERKSTAAKVLAYAGVNLTTLAVNTSLTVVFLKIYNGNILLAKSLALPPTLLLGFGLLRLFVFKHGTMMGPVAIEEAS